jgi:hypothetical protein
MARRFRQQGDLFLELPEQATVVPLDTPPAALTAGASTALIFTALVREVEVENNSGEDKTVAFGGAATAGSRKVLAGEVRLFTIPAGGATTLGIYGASASPLNGEDANNVIVEGRA